jgi:hypothetical protein
VSRYLNDAYGENHVFSLIIMAMFKFNAYFGHKINRFFRKRLIKLMLFHEVITY